MAYYFVVALPRHNAARLKFEQDKYAEQKQEQERRDNEGQLEKARQQGKVEAKQVILEVCLNSADEESERYVLLNGGAKTARGTIEASRSVWDDAEKQKKAQKDECYREYNR